MQHSQPNQPNDPVLLSETVLRRILDHDYTHRTASIHAKAFANDKDEESHSVSREKHTTALKLQSLAPQPERFGVAALAVADYETVDQVVRHAPTTDDDGHCDAVGHKTAKVKEYLRKQAVLLITPPSVPA